MGNNTPKCHAQKRADSQSAGQECKRSNPQRLPTLRVAIALV